MIDELFDRHYQSGRAELNATLGKAFHGLSKAVGDAFKVLNKIEYQEPWATKPKRARCN